MSELIQQWAIRKPDGELLQRAPSTASLFSGLFGCEPEEPKPVVFDTFEDALSTLQSLQREALNRYGLTWYGVVESRLCTPFSVTNPSERLVSEIQQWMGGES